MKKTYWLILIFIFQCVSVFCQTSQEYMKMAEKTYDNGKEAKAKELYLKAAAMNNPDAHFAIAYKFVVTKEKSIFHFAEAAKMGHAKALEEVLDILFFRVNSLSNANPELAMEIYNQAKSKNTSLMIYDEEVKVSTLNKAIEAGPFDAKAFIVKFGIKENELNTDYGIWELASEASRGGRFGPPDTKLVLQLVSRGSSVPAELEYAVDTTYFCWKTNEIFEFNVCDYVSSGNGLSYCSAKTEQEENKKYLMRINELIPKLRNNSGTLLRNSFDVASRFFEEKAWKEELHGGSGFAAWTRESINKQKTEYLNLIEEINNGINPDTLRWRKDSDKILYEIYQTVLKRVKKNPITDINASVDEEGILSVQRFWISYRDSTSKLLNQIFPFENENIWKEWLNEIRIHELKQILTLYE